MQWIVVAVGAIVLGGCAGAPPRVLQVGPSQRLVQEDYTVAVPNEEGWLRVGYADNVSLGRRSQEPDATVVIEGHTFEFPAQASTQDALAAWVDARTRQRLPAERFGPPRTYTVPDNTKHALCVRTATLVEDRAAVKRTADVRPMHLDVAEVTCRSRRNPERGVSVVFSYRHYPEAPGAVTFAGDAARVLDGVTIRPEDDGPANKQSLSIP